MKRLHGTVAIVLIVLIILLMGVVGWERRADEEPTSAGELETSPTAVPTVTPIPTTPPPSISPQLTGEVMSVRKPSQYRFQELGYIGNVQVEINSPCLLFSGPAGWLLQRFLQWTPDGSQLLLEYGSYEVLNSERVGNHANYGLGIFLVESDGSRLQRVISPSAIFHVVDRFSLFLGHMSHFDVSPDGSQVVYSTCNYPTGILFEESPGYQISPEWAPEVGKFKYEIAVANIDGTNPRRLTENKVLDNYPVWSPDGSRIAFIARGYWPSDYATLYTMAADGSDVRRVFERPQWPSKGFATAPPVWSPDGKYLAVVAYEDGPDSYELDAPPLRRFLYTISADGLVRRIAQALSVPSWSPDGHRIALAIPHGEGVALYTLAANGTDPRFVAHISEQAIWIETVSWSPDGTRILFTCDTQCVANVQSGTVSKWPVHFEGRFSIAAWSPDGSRIAARRAEELSELRARAMWIEEMRQGVSFAPLYTDAGVVLYTAAPDGTDPQVLVTLRRMTLLAENSGYQDVAIGVAACSEGFVVSEPEEHPGLVKDCQTLMKLRNTLAGDIVLNWSAGTPLDQWEGVIVGGSPPRVTGLISGAKLFLNGTLPAGLAQLEQLEVLDLSFNHLTGTISPELGQLAHLEELNLAHNELSGSIPAELGKLTGLRNLNLGGNRLHGSIPTELSALERLQEVSFYEGLYLAGNDLSGCVAAEIPDIWVQASGVERCDESEGN